MGKSRKGREGAAVRAVARHCMDQIKRTLQSPPALSREEVQRRYAALSAPPPAEPATEQGTLFAK